MKKKNNYIIYPFLILGLVTLLISSCKKDDKTDENTVKDIDGNVYHIVKIGNQTWMVENLKVTKYNDGTPITKIENNMKVEMYNNSDWSDVTYGIFCSYDYTTKGDSIQLFGYLYNDYAVKSGKLAPKGWHIPLTKDWEELYDFLGGEDVAGGKLKETGNTHWKEPNVGATNLSGFTGLPGGWGFPTHDITVNNGVVEKWNVIEFKEMGERGLWWSASCGRFILDYEESDFWETGWSIYDESLVSIRCIKD
jgi:uncharacterized protein (TIGR02145 family)